MSTIGRPPRAGSAAIKMICIRLTDQEHQDLVDTAKSQGLKPTELIRRAAMEWVEDSSFRTKQWRKVHRAPIPLEGSGTNRITKLPASVAAEKKGRKTR